MLAAKQHSRKAAAVELIDLYINSKALCKGIRIKASLWGALTNELYLSIELSLVQKLQLFVCRFEAACNGKQKVKIFFGEVKIFRSAQEAEIHFGHFGFF